MIPAFSVADYLAAFLRLLPRGRAWALNLATTATQVCAGLMAGYARNNARAAALVADAFPGTTVELLPEWEASLGLPDLCETDPQTLAQRRRAVTARLAGAGGQSVPFFENLCLALGYEVTITEYTATFRAGHATAGTPCGDAFVDAWTVNGPTFTTNRFTAGGSAAGEPLQTWGNTALQCMLTRLKPAHTAVLFHYS
jgi:uncharacterized protein YmfQ (DUF2313 family)